MKLISPATAPRVPDHVQTDASSSDAPTAAADSATSRPSKRGSSPPKRNRKRLVTSYRRRRHGSLASKYQAACKRTRAGGGEAARGHLAGVGAVAGVVVGRLRGGRAFPLRNVRVHQLPAHELVVDLRQALVQLRHLRVLVYRGARGRQQRRRQLHLIPYTTDKQASGFTSHDPKLTTGEICGYYDGKARHARTS